MQTAGPARFKAIGGRLRETRPSRTATGQLTSSHGSESEWTQGLWSWGIPESGDIELVCRWPAEHLTESRIIVEGDLLRDAAAHAVRFWDKSQDEGVATHAAEEIGRTVPTTIILPDGRA